MDGRLNRTLFVVVVIDEYSADEVFVYTDPESADRKVLSRGRQLFDEAVFSSAEEVLDYQHSDEWWDNDNRCRVTVTRILGEVNEDY